MSFCTSLLASRIVYATQRDEIVQLKSSKSSEVKGHLTDHVYSAPRVNAPSSPREHASSDRSSMSAEHSKTSHWKGQSRVQKCCHWCAKKQESKPFQACSRCKEVIYCSKECQVASWPHHKPSCNYNAQNKEALQANPDVANNIAVFKKWHGSHVPALRHAIICALDLGNHPSRVNDGVLYLELTFKRNHEKLPPNQKYEPVKGCIYSMDEILEMIGRQGGSSIIESTKQNSDFMKEKGGLGIGMIMLQAHDFCDIVKVTLPTPAAAKAAQETDDWGDNWVEGLRLAVSL